MWALDDLSLTEAALRGSFASARPGGVAFAGLGLGLTATRFEALILAEPATLDVVVASTTGKTLQVMRNAGRGALAPQPLQSSPLRARAVTVADLDRQRGLDTVIAGFTKDSVRVLLDAGAGAAVELPAVTLGADPVALATAVVDGNGAADVVVANAGDDTVQVLLTDGSGTLIARPARRRRGEPAGQHRPGTRR